MLHTHMSPPSGLRRGGGEERWLRVHTLRPLFKQLQVEPLTLNQA